jgi:DNA-3-methyladenine glycosylase
VTSINNTVPRFFYQKPTAEVARLLIGKVLVRYLNGHKISGTIVETEAYGHADNDQASHAWHGMTERNKIMFGKVGIAYVYFTYGNHHCINVSAREDAPAGAVLIRSLEPVDGIDKMKELRGFDDVYSLTTGPGKLTQAMNISLKQNGVDLTNPKSEIKIEEGPARHTVATSRIGISKATDVQWRFVDPSSAFLSRKPKLASLRVK